MFKAIIILGKSLLCIEWWVNVDALHLAGEFRFQSLKREQVVAVYDAVVKLVFFGHVARGMVGKLRVFQQDARLKARALLLPDPSQFEFRLLRHKKLSAPGTRLRHPMPCQ
jgi:hypothetical protein